MPFSLSRRTFLGSTAAAGLAMAAKKTVVERPNVLIVLADDVASWMLGCYGNAEFRTPNIDTLARSGIRFSDSFACTPMGSPSRATLFTGRTPAQHGIFDSLDEHATAQVGQAAAPASFASEVMLSDILAGQGYNCGYVGKWHLGGDEKPQHGFQYTYTMTGGISAYRDPAMYLNGERRQEQGYLTELMTQRACEFLEKQSTGKPFFLTVAYLNAHMPYEGHPQKYYDMYAGAKFEKVGYETMAPNAFRDKEMLLDPVKNIRGYAAGLTALDDQIPVLLRKLLQRGLTDNTLVVFTSDNGYLLGRHGLWSKGHASQPINMYDEVVGVPMIWVWPGRIPAEGVAPDLISSYDLVPSICEATGVSVPNRNLCGRSYAKIARREALPKKEPWKGIVFGQFRNAWMARDKRYKLVLRDNGAGPNELYDVANDPHERINQYANNQFITVKNGMTDELNAWRKRTS